MRPIELVDLVYVRHGSDVCLVNMSTTRSEDELRGIPSAVDRAADAVLQLYNTAEDNVQPTTPV
jgi:hypothetical protein